jgi:hypothetical protein
VNRRSFTRLFREAVSLAMFSSWTLGTACGALAAWVFVSKQVIMCRRIYDCNRSGDVCVTAVWAD